MVFSPPLCNWKTKKLRHFDNSIAHWSMPVKQLLRNLQMSGAFIVLQVKNDE
jgi:hypothetical protein